MRVLYLAEFPFYVMKFASFGWSISEEQRKLIQSLARGVVYIPDKNKYEEAIHQAGQLCQSLWCKIPSLPCDDPEHLSHEQILAM